MSLQRIDLKIEGTTELLMHNVRLANPRDVYTRRLSELTTEKKKKSSNKDQIATEMERVEWEGGLYHDAIDGGKNDGIGPYIPARNIHKAILEAARMTKEGPTVEQGTFTGATRFKLEYDGPRDIEGLYTDGRFVDLRVAVLGGRTKIMRCRPIFREWGCALRFMVDPRRCSPEQLVEFVRSAGLYKGVCDGHRGIFGMGRFRVVE